MITSLLNKKITIEKAIETNSVMPTNPMYENYISTWANVYVRSGQVLFGENEELLFTTEFTIRYNSLTKAINNKFRIKYNDQYFKINEIIETEPKQALKIIAVHYYGE